MVDAHVELQADIPQIQIEVDLAAAQAYGLKPGDVRRASSTLIMGEEVGDLFRNGQDLRRATCGARRRRGKASPISRTC